MKKKQQMELVFSLHGSYVSLLMVIFVEPKNLCKSMLLDNPVEKKNGCSKYLIFSLFKND